MNNRFGINIDGTYRRHTYINDFTVIASFESDDDWKFTTARLDNNVVIGLRTNNYFNTKKKLPYTFYVAVGNEIKVVRQFNKINAGILYLWGNSGFSYDSPLDTHTNELITDLVYSIAVYTDKTDSDIEWALENIIKFGGVTPYEYGLEKEVVNDLLTKALNEL